MSNLHPHVYSNFPRRCCPVCHKIRPSYLYESHVARCRIEEQARAAKRLAYKAAQKAAGFIHD